MATSPVQAFPNISPPPSFGKLSDVSTWARRVFEAIQVIRKGKTENIAQFTMGNGTTTSVFTDTRLSPQSVVVLDPMTLAAASLLYTSPGIFALEANRLNGQWTFTHASAAAANHKFALAIIG